MDKRVQNVPFRVDAKENSIAKQWLSTDLVIANGVNLRIRASGTAWLIAGDPTQAGGPNGGQSNNPQCGDEGIICGALYAKVGTNEAGRFFVGELFDGNIAQGGVLYLGYADIDWANNAGGFDVLVDTFVVA